MSLVRDGDLKMKSPNFKMKTLKRESSDGWRGGGGVEEAGGRVGEAAGDYDQ